MDKRRIYISDIHMNAGKGFQAAKGEHPYEWLGPDEAKRFTAFLNYINDPDTVQEVIIIGDLLDDWVYPVDMVPPSLESIVKAPINKEIVQALKKLAKNRRSRSSTYPATMIWV